MPKFSQRQTAPSDREAIILAGEKGRLRRQEEHLEQQIEEKRETLRDKVSAWLAAHEIDRFTVTVQEYGRNQDGCRVNILNKDTKKGRSPMFMTIAWEGEIFAASKARHFASGVCGMIKVQMLKEQINAKKDD